MHSEEAGQSSADSQGASQFGISSSLQRTWHSKASQVTSIQGSVLGGHVSSQDASSGLVQTPKEQDGQALSLQSDFEVHGVQAASFGAQRMTAQSSQLGQDGTQAQEASCKQSAWSSSEQRVRSTKLLLVGTPVTPSGMQTFAAQVSSSVENPLLTGGTPSPAQRQED